MGYEQDPAKIATKSQTVAVLQESTVSLMAVKNQLDELILRIAYAVGGSATGCNAKWCGYCEMAKTQHIQSAAQYIERARGLIESLSVMVYEPDDELE